MIPVKVNQNHKPHATYERDDLRDVKINRTTRSRLAKIKSDFGFKNLDELINPALDAFLSSKAKK